MIPTLAEAVTASFYAWEIRGRGWWLSDYPVVLEPPFRHCFMLPSLASPRHIIDDGKRPTFLSSLVEGVKDTLVGKSAISQTNEEPFEEPEPARAERANSRVSLRLTVPVDFRLRPEAIAQFLRSLSTTLSPVAFEIVGRAGKVAIQVTCAEVDAALVGSQLEASIPEAVVLHDDDLLSEAWDEEAKHLVVDFGLSHEFFLPLGSVSVGLDPFVTLIPALAASKEGEILVYQVLFEGVRNPWSSAIREALDDGTGGSIMADAPEFLPLSREKLRTPLHAVSLRVAAQARSTSRAWDLVRLTGAFIRQCGRPGSNELLPLENTDFPDELHASSVLWRETYRSGMLLSGEELGLFVHLPDASVKHPGLIRSIERTKALPNEARGREFVLGENVHRGERMAATIGEAERLSHTWIIGASGAGKSTLLQSLILQDLERGNGIVVLDPHGDLIDDVLARMPKERIDDVILFDPSDTEHPIGFNVLSAGSEIERTLLASDLVGVFRRLSTSWGDQMSSVLGNAVLAILESERGGTLLDLRHFLVDDRFRREFLGTVDDDEIRFFWEREYPLIGSRSIGPILTRLDTFLRPKVIRHIVGQRDGKLDLGRVLSKRQVLLAKLSHGAIGEENSYLMGSLIVGKLLELALARQQLAKEERAPFFLYADEFQHFLTPTVETLLSGARKYALGVTLAHQTLGQLAQAPKVLSALSGNAYTRIAFRTSEEDARRVAEGFSFFEASDLVRLRRGEAIVRMGSSENDFNLKTLPPKLIASNERGNRLARLSRERYGIPVAEVREALANAREPIRSSEDAVPQATAEETPPAPTPMSIERKPLARRKVLADTPPEPLGHGGQEHKYLQHLVKRLAEERGFRAIIEDDAGEGKTDVVLKKDTLTIGCEISVTTDVEHELGNLRKCLSAGFGGIVAIVPDKRRREKLAKRAAEEAIAARVISPEEIVSFLDEVAVGSATAESTVRGYKVKVKRQAMSQGDLAGRRSAVAEVIARSIGRSEG